jgi:hypothetical protein
MKLIAAKLAASAKADRLQYRRDDGTTCENAMPRQGILPHDLIHYIVESQLGLANGFLSLVARGADASFAMQTTHDANNRDIERQAIQVEAVVEALQTQLWNGAFDPEAFAYGVQTASHARGVEPASLDPAQAESLVYAPAIELHRQWSALPTHASIEWTFTQHATP